VGQDAAEIPCGVKLHLWQDLWLLIPMEKRSSSQCQVYVYTLSRI